jgi:hypothetical protein
VRFPDENHARLYDLGRRIEDGENIPERELQQVFRTWQGFVAHDPDAGAPFASWRDVPDFATDILHDAGGEAERAAMTGQDWGRVPFYVDPEQLAQYVARYRVPEDRFVPARQKRAPPRPRQLSFQLG